MEGIINKVREFADEAHGTQMSKYAPERYIFHPIRVMETCRVYENKLSVLAAALLHDVLEKTLVKREELLAFLESAMNKSAATKTLNLVVELTDAYTKEAYPEWNDSQCKEKEHERISHISPSAQTIKYADILDNSEQRVVYAPDSASTYLKESRDVLKITVEGNKELYTKTMEIVQDGLKKVR